MRAKNLEDRDAAPVQDWASITRVLDGGFTQAPDSGGPKRFTTWLATLNADGSPHMTAVGAIWVDGLLTGVRLAGTARQDTRAGALIECP
jgi:hypothetical protein